MASFFCSSKFFMLLVLIAAVPIGYLIKLETTKPSSHVYEYHGVGWMRECTKWDEVNRRFIVTNMEGGLGQISVPEDDDDTGSVLEEITVVKDPALTGNASLGMIIDRPRNRVLVAVGDMYNNGYSALAAYDITSWNRLFLTQLSISGDNQKTFADDVAVDEEGNTYVTDVKGSKIWKVGPTGEFLYTITSPLFRAKEWYRNFFGLNGIDYHPNGYLLVIHTFTGNLFKINVRNNNEIKLVKLPDGPLTFGDGLELLSPTQLLVAGNPATRLVESTDDWESAKVVGKSSGLSHRIATGTTVKDGKVYVNHLFGMGYPKKKHVILEAVFSS